MHKGPASFAGMEAETDATSLLHGSNSKRAALKAASSLEYELSPEKVATALADANHVGIQYQQQMQDQLQLQHQQPTACPLLKSAEKAVSTRLLPPLLMLVMVSYIDRTNLSFASIQLSEDLKLSSTLYGLGSGAFFLAYAVGQIPSNYLLLRFGGPTWLAAISLAWGAAASAFALVRGPISFVLLRLLLGLAESGAVPGTWYYISQFYPPDRTTVPYSLIETGITVSQVIAAPFAAGLLMLDGVAGLRGWQWLFLLEGLPALLLGCLIRFWLPVSVQSANFLAADQKAALHTALAASASPQIEDRGSAKYAETAALATEAAAVGDDHSLAAAPQELASKPALLQPIIGPAKGAVKHGSAAAAAAAAGHGSTNGVEAAHGSSSAQYAYSDDLDRSDVSIIVNSNHNIEQQVHFPIKLQIAASYLPSAAEQQQVNNNRTGSDGRSFLLPGTEPSHAATAADTGATRNCNGVKYTAVACGNSSNAKTASSSGSRRKALAAVLKNKVILYAGCWRILHDIPGNGILYWTPKIVLALLGTAATAGVAAAAVSTDGESSSTAADPSNLLGSGNSTDDSSSHSSPGVQVVLLSAIPYAAASLFHLLNAWHSQKHSERHWHIAGTWLAGAAALLLLPLAAASHLAGNTSHNAVSAAAGVTVAGVISFMLLTVAHVGINGANGVQTGLVAGSIVQQEKALGIAVYNTIACIGSFWGPLLIGMLHDATGGYILAMVLLGVSLAGAAVMVVRFKPHRLDDRLQQMAQIG